MFPMGSPTRSCFRPSPKFSLPGAPARYASIARAMGLATGADTDDTAGLALVAGLLDLNRSLGVPRLGDCKGVDRSRFETVVDKMAQDALASGSPANNPVVPTAEDIVRLYREAW